MKYRLAQLNIATARTELDDPAMADFMAALDPVNAEADAAPGFVWRLQTESGNATSVLPFDERTLVNLSVWESLEALKAFVASGGHAAIMRRRREWFEKSDLPYVVLWWIPAGHSPSVDEAKERLLHLRDNGPGPSAFTFSKSFPAPDSE